jgi:hypothetical protein
VLQQIAGDIKVQMEEAAARKVESEGARKGA